MRPVRIIAALLFAATVTMLMLLAAPAWAASTTPPVVIHVSPSPVVAGHSVTVSGSVGPEAAGSDCSSIILYSDAFAPTNNLGYMTPVYTTAKPSGTFTTTTTIPRSKPAGTNTITGRCGGGNLGVSATLVVRAAASPTTTPAPTAPPVTHPPVSQPAVPAPAVTGSPTQPATTAAARPASRWIIPGLVALGSGALAVLGVWLLYRRRHPAGPSRQGRSRMAH